MGSSHIGDLDDKRKDVARAPRREGRRPSAESKRDAGKSVTPTSTAETETPVGKKAVLMWEGKEERKEPKGMRLLLAPHGEHRRGRAARACWISYLIKHQLIGSLQLIPKTLSLRDFLQRHQ